jgi:hypothetical protein
VDILVSDVIVVRLVNQLEKLNETAFLLGKELHFDLGIW